ncbi:hypothetical protein E2C01_017094 [Portunus trituberculatus]|uniref:Uncharacterized protein n=1 Tax=Portunus trituberculatus TaxID=210409 RepID=A0A5B7DSG5_PORTR|nr:hypothetical protein [Portunus trituberculatus]
MTASTLPGGPLFTRDSGRRLQGKQPSLGQQTTTRGVSSETTNRYSDTWDVMPVLQQLKTMAPAHNLTLKLAMLMALTQAACVQSLHLLVLKEISIGEDSITMWLGGNIKQCWPKCNIQFVRFSVYTRDTNLCVCDTLRLYIAKTKQLRAVGQEDGQLFINFVKPYKPVSKDTIARWIRTMLDLSGADTARYTAGSMRPAAASRNHSEDGGMRSLPEEDTESPPVEQPEESAGSATDVPESPEKLRCCRSFPGSMS